jgi:hypothetical protein
VTTYTPSAYAAYPGYGPAEAVAAPSSGRALWIGYLVFWMIMVGASVIVWKLAGMGVIAGLIIVGVTLPAVAWKPLFGLCLVYAILAVGGGMAVAGVSADRGIALLYGLGFLLSLPFSHRTLEVKNSVFIACAAMGGLGMLSILWSPFPSITLPQAFTLVQVSILVLLAFSTLRTREDVQWILRAAIAGAFVFTVGARVMGVATIAKGERLTVGGGGVFMNPNQYGMLLSLSVLACLYLFRADTIKALRPFYIPVGAVLFLNMMLTGSRKSLFGLLLALMIPTFFPKRIIKKPLAFFGSLILLMLILAAVSYGLENLLPEEVAWRFQDRQFAEKSLINKFAFISSGISYVLDNPLGSGLGIHRTSSGMAIHNDFFYLMANLGYVGAGLYLVLLIPLIVHVHRAPDSVEKTFATWVVIFLFLSEMNAPMILLKFLWLYYCLAWVAANPEIGWERAWKNDVLLRAPAG